jgi:hypothetical protein
MHKKDFKRLTKKTKQKKKTLKNSTKPSRSGRPEGRPAEAGKLYLRQCFEKNNKFEKLQFIYKFGLTKVVQSIKIFFNNRVLGSEQEKFEYLFFFSISEENFLHEESDIEVRGFPGQTQMSYVCYHARTRKYGKEEEEDVYVHVFKEIEKKINDTHFIIKYTHQTSGGQSGGPVILHTDNDVQLIGIHVSGDQVSEINFI